jgi:hypothetical protein
MEEGGSSLPTKNDQEFKPFVRRLPEFKFWHSATRAIVIAFFASWTEFTNLPVFWPVLVVYWLLLVVLTMRRQIQHMLSKCTFAFELVNYILDQNANCCIAEYRYVPWDFGKAQYAKSQK